MPVKRADGSIVPEEQWASQGFQDPPPEAPLLVPVPVIGPEGPPGADATTIPMGGDVTGSIQANTINSIQSFPLVLTNPQLDDVIGWDGSKFVALAVAGIQGPTGATGSAGATGATGANGAAGPTGPAGFGTTSAPFVQPTFGTPVTVFLSPMSWGIVGQYVFIGGGGGTYLVVGVDTMTSSFSAEPTGWDNVAPATIIAGGVNVIPTGVRGPTGSTGATGATGGAGPTGSAGGVGATGPTGPSSYSVTAAGFTQPNTGLNVQVTVDSTGWMVATLPVYMDLGGYYDIVTVDGPTLVTLQFTGVGLAGGSVIGAGGLKIIAMARGATGATGPAGAAGAAGATGATGAAGPAGANGLNGTNGADGATGATGATGAAGSTRTSIVTYTDNWTTTPLTCGMFKVAWTAPATKTSWTFSAHLAAPASFSVQARLFDKTNNTPVAGSTISTSSTTPTEVTSGALAIPVVNATYEYYVQISIVSGSPTTADPGVIYSAFNDLT